MRGYEMFASIKTTVIGFILIGMGIVGLKYFNLDGITGGAIITAGLGMLAAKDNDLTGGTRQQ
jgi:hypothetical protein